MFCSATPALINCWGNASAYSVRTPNPRSPVMRAMRGSAAASSVSLAMKASRTGNFRVARINFAKRGVELLPLGRPVMPQHSVFHERHPLALHSVANDDVRLVRG